MTTRRSDQVKEVKPGAYYPKYMKDVTIEELKAFVGLRLIIENCLQKRRYPDYWKSDGKQFVIETPGFNKVMSRDRFLAIWSFLHIIDEQDPAIDKTDRIYKVRPLINSLLTKFRQFYNPGEHLSLDEGMIPCKNRLAIKQFIKDKPIKWGIKAFLLCDSRNGYIYNAEVYTGRENLDHPNLGITGNVVTRLLTSCDLNNKGHCLFMDRYYNSVTLFDHLHEVEQTHAIGTAMTNRKHFPVDVAKSKLKKRGESAHSCRGPITAVAWMDKKKIHFLSNCSDPTELSSVHRRTKDGSLVAVPCPQVVTDYNKFMGGTDLNDQMTRLQKSRRHYKWPRRLFLKSMMWALYNSYILYREVTSQSTTFSQYVDTLCHDLIGTHRSTHVHKPLRGAPIPVERRLQEVGLHMPEKREDTGKGQTCKVCSSKVNYYNKHKTINGGVVPPRVSKSQIRCSECEVYLCVKIGSTCWRDFHTKAEYWR